MLDVLSLVRQLNRPSLLVRSARFGLDDYSRSNCLPRLLKRAVPPRFGEAIILLLEAEDEVNEQRITKRAEYSVSRHIDLLIAIMGEARLLRASTGVQ